MEFILHIFGVCSDNHSHIDVMDMFVGGIGGGALLMYLKYYFRASILIIKDVIPKRSNKQS
jgi:hypothetical protein